MQLAYRSKNQDRPDQDVAEFDIQMLLPIGMTIVVFGIGIAYGLSVMEDTADDLGKASCADRNDSFTNFNETSDQCYNGTFSTSAPTSAAFNATGDGIDAVAKFPEKLGLIVTVIIAAVVIGILVRYLFVRYS